jgi:hypothetical protein
MTKLLTGAALAIALLASPASARDMVLGSGLICDTKQQAERFVSLMGENVESALIQVNGEAGQPDACVVATIGYFPGQSVAEIVKNGKVIQVVEVLVMAVASGDDVKMVQPKMFYSVVETGQQAI